MKNIFSFCVRSFDHFRYGAGLVLSLLLLLGAHSLEAKKTATLPVAATPQPAPQMDLPRVSIRAGMRRIDAQLAATPQSTQIGLMFRKSMPTHEGMLFAFPNTAPRCFWMRNTYMPLTAAFIRADGTIINLADMQARSDRSHCSTEPAKFVLEMKLGWFKKAGIGAGFRLQHPLFEAQTP